MVSQLLHVAVGVIKCSQRGILISQRQKNQHLAGLWEFPGGKVESGENTTQALARELHEEVGIEVFSSQPLIKIIHHYPEKSVLLDVHIVDRFSGVAVGKEGQNIKWVAPESLDDVNFPDANRSIINALRYPERVLITGPYKSFSEFKMRLSKGLERDIGMVQFRVEEKIDFMEEFSYIKSMCEARNIKLAINSRLVERLSTVALQGPGLHLTSKDLHQGTINLDDFSFVGASCHNLEDINRANELQLDYIYLSSVLQTSSHPLQEPMGWSLFSELVEQSHMPCYALGGLSGSDIQMAKASGAQGLAGISCFW